MQCSHEWVISPKTSPGWRPGGSPALFHRAPGLACGGRGRAPYARTFGRETREDTAQFRRQTSFSGTIGRSAVNRPPPRKTVLILAEGQSVSARSVRTRSSSCPGGVCPRVSPHTAPAPTPRAMPTTVHCPGHRSLHVQHCLTREAGDPHQNPQNKMKRSAGDAYPEK